MFGQLILASLCEDSREEVSYLFIPRSFPRDFPILSRLTTPGFYTHQPHFAICPEERQIFVDNICNFTTQFVWCCTNSKGQEVLPTADQLRILKCRGKVKLRHCVKATEFEKISHLF